MKHPARLVLLLFSLVATFAMANNLQNAQHVIVVIQENRTPTNLFQQDTQLIQKGAHIVSKLPVADLCGNPQNYALTSQPLYACWDTEHNHSKPWPDWTKMWDNGAMDGACQISVIWTDKNNNNVCYPGTQTPPSCVNSQYPNWKQTCSYTYVLNSQFTTVPMPQFILDPYFQLASQFGYANYMFQTNQGPSFPAHQFLFSGTSAPEKYTTTDKCPSNGNYYCHEWFAAENAKAGVNTTYGCTASVGANIYERDPGFHELQGIYNGGYPCYHHPTLVDLLDQTKLTWKYYARSTASLWSAPDAIKNICQPGNGQQPGDVCLGQEWANNVQAVLPDQGNYQNDAAPILTDIEHCNLPNVSWVIPDGNWSDHAGPGSSPGDGGPSWVGWIVNAVCKPQIVRMEPGTGRIPSF